MLEAPLPQERRCGQGKRVPRKPSSPYWDCYPGAGNVPVLSRVEDTGQRGIWCLSCRRRRTAGVWAHSPLSRFACRETTGSGVKPGLRPWSAASGGSCDDGRAAQGQRRVDQVPCWHESKAGFRAPSHRLIEWTACRRDVGIDGEPPLCLPTFLTPAWSWQAQQSNRASLADKCRICLDGQSPSALCNNLNRV